MLAWWLMAKKWVHMHWHRILLIGTPIILVVILVVQFAYPTDRLLPFSSISDETIGGQEKAAAITQLNQQFEAKKVAIYFGDSASAYRSPALNEIGLQVNNTERVEAMDYPWYMRLIPTSLLWYGAVHPVKEPTYVRDDKVLASYMQKELGESCKVEPQFADLTYKDGRLQLVPARDGGTCEIDEVEQTLSSVTPILNENVEVRIAMERIAPAISDETAQKLATQIEERAAEGIPLKVKEETIVLPADQVLPWLEFAPKGNQLVVTVNADKSNEYYKTNVTPELAKPAGVTKVTTRDFTELERTEGVKGQTLDIEATNQQIVAFLQDKRIDVTAKPKAVEPQVEYTRSYTSTSVGITALITHYDQDQPGTFGVAFRELGGKRRAAQYAENESFVTASTYKLFVAFGTLQKVEDGDWKWTDEVTGGRNLSTCFDDMIVKSDNPCAEVLLEKLGYVELTEQLRDIGLANSGFTEDKPRTTASDLATFLTKLERGNLPIEKSSRDRLLDAMKRNTYRSGIPAGASGTVANKVGFLNGLLHDASIVYSPSGAYVLTIMSEGSSWASIAELTRQIEALRNQ